MKVENVRGRCPRVVVWEGENAPHFLPGKSRVDNNASRSRDHRSNLSRSCSGRRQAGELLKMQDLKARDLPGMRRAFVASVWLSGPRLLCRGVLMNTLLLLMTFVLVDDLRALHSVTVLKYSTCFSTVIISAHSVVY